MSVQCGASRTIVSNDRNFTKIIGRTNNNSVVNLHQHSFQALIKVDAVRGWIEDT